MMRFLIVVVGVVAGLLSVVWFTQTNLFVRLSDRTAPEIQVVKPPLAFGSGAVAFDIQTFEQGAGVSSFSAALQQGSKTVSCDAKETRRDPAVVSYSAACDAVSGALTAGPAALVLRAVDSSMWGNHSEASFPVAIDFTPPQIEALTLQHSVQTGGSELVLFRVHEERLKRVAVKVGSLSFPGAPARGLDPTFPEQAPVFVSVFALPMDWTSADAVRIVAEDEAENVTEVPLRFRVQENGRKDATITVSQTFLNEKVEPLIPKYELFVRRNKAAQADALLKAIPAAENREARFRLVNEAFRKLLDERLDQVLSVTTPERLWIGEFTRPMAAALSSNYGERRTYRFNDANFGSSNHQGFDLASTEQDVVRASNEGIVRLAEDFGLYGNTLVIDHGLGVFTLYGHLSFLQVKVGDRVLKGDIIARTGQTGFAGGDHLHFEIRVGKVPVTPIEWWDPKWYQDNITGKAEAAKARL